MGISFSRERFAQINETYNAWWNHQLNRPVMGIAVASRTPDRDEPKVPLLSQKTCNDLRFTPEQLVDRIDFELSKYEYYGDAFPLFNMECFGPGVVAAFLGASLENTTGSVWFHAPSDKPISELHFTYDPENSWLKRIKAIYQCAMERFEGKAIMGMVDLGGVMDVLSTFRPGDGLLLDLYDEPKEVQRVLSELSIFWHQFYRELNEVLAPQRVGYTDWSGIFSDKPSYILQSDFSYMVSPDMFHDFLLNEIQVTCRKLDRSIWHLDGIGELPHLDYLLSIEELDGVQWIPGAGNAPCHEWPEVYRKIQAKGKLIQLMNYDFVGIEKTISDLGNASGLQHPTQFFEEKDKDYALNWLKKLNVIE